MSRNRLMLAIAVVLAACFALGTGSTGATELAVTPFGDAALDYRIPNVMYADVLYYQKEGLEVPWMYWDSVHLDPPEDPNGAPTLPARTCAVTADVAQLYLAINGKAFTYHGSLDGVLYERQMYWAEDPFSPPDPALNPELPIPPGAETFDGTADVVILKATNGTGTATPFHCGIQDWDQWYGGVNFGGGVEIHRPVVIQGERIPGGPQATVFQPGKRWLSVGKNWLCYAFLITTDGVQIRDLTFEDGWNTPIVAIDPQGSAPIVIEGNRITRGEEHRQWNNNFGILVARPACPVVIRNNYIYSGDHTIFFSIAYDGSVDGSVIEGNTIESIGNVLWGVISLGSSRNVIVRNNTLTGSKNILGIASDPGSANNTVVGNNLSGLTAVTGIYVSGQNSLYQGNQLGPAGPYVDWWGTDRYVYSSITEFLRAPVVVTSSVSAGPPTPTMGNRILGNSFLATGCPGWSQGQGNIILYNLSNASWWVNGAGGCGVRGNTVDGNTFAAGTSLSDNVMVLPDIDASLDPCLEYGGGWADNWDACSSTDRNVYVGLGVARAGKTPLMYSQYYLYNSPTWPADLWYLSDNLGLYLPRIPKGPANEYGVYREDPRHNEPCSVVPQDNVIPGWVSDVPVTTRMVNDVLRLEKKLSRGLGRFHKPDGLPPATCPWMPDKEVAQADGLPGEGAARLMATPAADAEGAQPGLDVAYPNPANPETTIRFQLAAPERVSLEVFSLTGQRVRILVSGRPMGAGSQAVAWDGKDGQGRPMASGLYLVRLQAGARVDHQKVTLLR